MFLKVICTLYGTSFTLLEIHTLALYRKKPKIKYILHATNPLDIWFEYFQ